MKNINCPLIHNITNQSIDNKFQLFDQTLIPFSINTYPISTTPAFPFIQYVLSYFLRDRSYDSQNFTETSCRKQATNDGFCSYTYVGGYSPSINIVNHHFLVIVFDHIYDMSHQSHQHLLLKITIYLKQPIQHGLKVDGQRLICDSLLSQQECMR